jgi:hypothetical protein
MPTDARARRFRAHAAIIGTGALLMAGCGTVVDGQGADTKIGAAIEQGLNLSVESVVCPTDAEDKEGERFDCRVTTAGGSHLNAQVRIVNENADLRIVSVTGAGADDDGRSSRGVD